MNRRDTLKAAIAAPIIAAIPWYSEQSKADVYFRESSDRGLTWDNVCDHQFDGAWRHWEEFGGGGGGEAVCSGCGIGAVTGRQ
jgi:hypothetical protein